MMLTLRARFGLAPRSNPLFSTSSSHLSTTLQWKCTCRPTPQYYSSTSSSSGSVSLTPRLRFAPSPTGNLHLGGLRTALLNHLFARSTGGTWILRIEDTDQNRYVEGAIEGLQEALHWAGLQWDEGPSTSTASNGATYIQSERLPIYREHAQRLVSSGHAYFDFRPAEERSALEASPGRKTIQREEYSPPGQEEANDLIQQGRKYSIRLKFPPREVVHNDLVFGRTVFPADTSAEDPVLLKQDKWPTYHLSSVIDDHLMGITHVLRGEEWLPSIPKHLALYEAFGWEPPRFAHLALLMNEDGSKLSKRSGHASVQDYRRLGYEPEALINFIALIGYNHHRGSEEQPTEGQHHESEVMTMQELVRNFDLARVSQSRAALNLSKLDYLNGQHLRIKARAEGTAAQSELFQRLKAGLQERYKLSGEGANALDNERLKRVMLLIADRADTIPQVIEQAKVLFEAPDWLSDSSRQLRKSVSDQAYRTAIQLAISQLGALDSEQFSASETVSSHIHRISADLITQLPPELSKKAKGKGALMKPLRHALTGERSGPMVPDIISMLGKDKTVSRLQEALKQM